MKTWAYILYVQRIQTFMFIIETWLNRIHLWLLRPLHPLLRDLLRNLVLCVISPHESSTYHEYNSDDVDYRCFAGLLINVHIHLDWFAALPGFLFVVWHTFNAAYPEQRFFVPWYWLTCNRKSKYEASSEFASIAHEILWLLPKKTLLTVLMFVLMNFKADSNPSARYRAIKL